MRTEEEAHYVRKNWLEGRCPCCGMEIGPWPVLHSDEETHPRAVAEGVVLCGRCIQNQHDAEDVLPSLLELLLPRRVGD